jgi:hypothetical protein
MYMDVVFAYIRMLLFPCFDNRKIVLYIFPKFKSWCGLLSGIRPFSKWAMHACGGICIWYWYWCLANTGHPLQNWRRLPSTHTHTHTCGFLLAVRHGGVDGVLSLVNGRATCRKGHVQTGHPTLSRHVVIISMQSAYIYVAKTVRR